jgi:integrase
LTDIERGEFRLKSKKRCVFSELAEEYMAKHGNLKRSAQRDRQTLNRHLIPHFGKHILSGITPKMVTAYNAERAQVVKPATVNRELTLLKTMFNLGIRWGYADANPVREVKLFREESIKQRVLMPEEEERLLSACTGKRVHLKPVLLLLLNTGARLREILSLRWESLNLTFGQIVITATNSKAKRQRFIPLNAVARQVLTELRATVQSEYVFPSISAWKSLKWIHTAFWNACREAGIRGLRLHDLRHTFASRLAAMGIDLVTIKDLLGHASIVTTLRYAHSASHRAAVEMLCDGLAKKDSHKSVTSDGSAVVAVKEGAR